MITLFNIFKKKKSEEEIFSSLCDTGFKKYCIFRVTTGIVIMTVLGINKEDDIRFERIYFYDLVESKDVDISDMDNYYIFGKAIKQRIEYKSDNIEDCYEYIENVKIEMSANKYNI